MVDSGSFQAHAAFPRTSGSSFSTAQVGSVEASSAVVEFSDKLNNRVDAKRIEAMPLSGRDFNSLLNVTPGVQHNPGGGFQAVNVSGGQTMA